MAPKKKGGKGGKKKDDSSEPPHDGSWERVSKRPPSCPVLHALSTELYTVP